MGLEIGNIPNTLSAGRIEVHPEIPVRSREESAPELRAGAEGQEEQITAGFGENTISIPGLAARTIGRNMTDARKMVPTFEEMRQAQEAQAEERRAQAREELEARWLNFEENRQEPVVRIDFQRAESQARAQAREFIQSSNQTAQETRARIESQEPEVQERQASIETANRAFTFTPPSSAQFDFQG